MGSLNPHYQDKLWQENDSLLGERTCKEAGFPDEENLRELFPEIIFQSLPFHTLYDC